MHPIVDKAEVAIDFPDKFYSGGFGRDSSYEARAEDDGVLIRLVRQGSEKRAAAIHLHHFLLAGILEDLARSLDGRADRCRAPRTAPSSRQDVCYSARAGWVGTATQTTGV